MMQQPAGVVPPPMAQPTMDQQQQQQQQQWMMMQAQQQAQPMWNQQQPAALQSQPQPQSNYTSMQPASSDEIRTLWIGDLQYWMDESYIHSCFSHTGEVVSVKVIRNKQTSQPEGYGFIEFVSRAAAEKALQTYNGTLMPNVEQNFRLNWATFGSGERRPNDGADFTIFVGDLASDVTDYMLQETFRSHYTSIKGAKVVTDRTTGHSKGYGFVRFGDESEQVRAMSEMNGMFCSTRPMRIGPATTKKNVVGPQTYPNGCQEALSNRGLELVSAEMLSPLVRGLASYQSAPATENENDPNNTTIFVGGLDSNVTDDHLRQVFSQFGELVHVKIPVGKRCGFVQFANRACAEEALLMLNGTQLGGQSIRLSWGRSQNNKQDASAGVAPQQPDPNMYQYGGYPGYNQGYQNYGYAPPPPQDPNMYAYGGYPGYANYHQQQQ